jgi:GTP cyclohydrolase IA
MQPGLFYEAHGMLLDILRESGKAFCANDNISSVIHEEDLARMENLATDKIQELLEILLIDTKNDHNTKDTARRMAKMYVRETMHGRYTPMPRITDFPNVKNLDELYTVGPISVRSLCSHHFAPIVGECYIGILPSDKVIGLSKFNRLVEWVMARPQIQEEATVQIADTIQDAIKPRGLAVVVNATHGCMTLRGVKDHATKMTTSVMRGLFQTSLNLRTEFLTFIKMSQ